MNKSQYDLIHKIAGAKMPLALPTKGPKEMKAKGLGFLDDSTAAGRKAIEDKRIKFLAENKKTASAHDRQYIEGHRATPSRDIGAAILDDFIKGAQRNPRLGHIQYEGVHTTDMTALEIAKTACQLQALAEAEFTLKEASEALNLPEATIQAVLEAVK